MNGLEFIASIINSISWPTALVVIFLLVRKEAFNLLSLVLPRVQELKYKEWSLKLQAIEKLEDKKKVVPKDNERNYPDDPKRAALFKELDQIYDARVEELMNIAKASPKAAILMAWQGLENALLKAFPDTKNISTLLKKHGDEINRRFPRMTDEIEFLRNIRNEAVHDTDDSANYKIDTAEHFISVSQTNKIIIEKRFIPPTNSPNL